MLVVLFAHKRTKSKASICTVQLQEQYNNAENVACCDRIKKEAGWIEVTIWAPKLRLSGHTASKKTCFSQSDCLLLASLTLLSVLCGV